MKTFKQLDRTSRLNSNSMTLHVLGGKNDVEVNYEAGLLENEGRCCMAKASCMTVDCLHRCRAYDVELLCPFYICTLVFCFPPIAYSADLFSYLD
jgi:hypothetical protein